jgi:hypothetical protein
LVTIIGRGTGAASRAQDQRQKRIHLQHDDQQDDDRDTDDRDHGSRVSWAAQGSTVAAAAARLTFIGYFPA